MFSEGNRVSLWAARFVQQVNVFLARISQLFCYKDSAYAHKMENLPMMECVKLVVFKIVSSAEKVIPIVVKFANRIWKS